MNFTVVDYDMKQLLSEAKHTCSACLEAGHYRSTCPMLYAKTGTLPADAKDDIRETVEDDAAFMTEFLDLDKYTFPADTFTVF